MTDKRIKNKIAVFVGSSYMVLKCLNLSQNIFKKIYFVSNQKIIKDKIKKIELITFNKLKRIKIDYLFSILNSKLIPENILSKVNKMALNFHNGPLPRYGGLNSSTWAIINKEKNHGCCWHEIKKKIDTGDIVLKENFTINNTLSAYQIDTTSSLIGIRLFENILKKIKVKKKITKYKQNLKKKTYFGLKDLEKFPNLGFLNFEDTYENNLRIFRSLNFKDKKKIFILKPKIYTNNGILIVKNFTKFKYASYKKYKTCKIIEVKKSSLVIKTKDYLAKVYLTTNIKKTKNIRLTKLNKFILNEIRKTRK